jgi:hypothetical protein
MQAKTRNPRSRAEWQEAVNAAEFCLMVDSCEQYGLITGPKINAERCQEILERGKTLGILPAPHDELIKDFMRTDNR